MLHHGSAAPAPGCGVSLATLASERGISKDAARRLVKAGKVSAHRVPGAHGPEWCVHLDSPVEARHGGAGDAPGLRDGPATVAPASDLAGLVALVERLQVENRQLAEAAATWQTRALMLEERLALTAPESPVEAPTAAESPEPTQEPSAPWWRSWWRW
jgi:hypothetical protein